MNSIYSICIIQNSSLNIFLGGAKEDTNIYIQLIEGLNLFNKSTKNNIKRKSNISFLILKIKNHNCGVARYEAGGRTGSPKPKSFKWSRIRASGKFLGNQNCSRIILSEQPDSNVPKWHVSRGNVHVAHLSEWWHTVRRRNGQSTSSRDDGWTSNTNPADSRSTRPRDQIVRITNWIRQWQRWQRKAWFLNFILEIYISG